MWNIQTSCMSKDPTNNREKNQFAQNSSLYQEFLAEREEILKHKWIESEKAGKDVGFEKALLDWIRNHRDEWKNVRRQEEAPGTAEPN